MKGITRIGSFFKQFENFLIIGHSGPDGDCVGSQLALKHWLIRKGKNAEAYNAGPFLRREIKQFESRFRHQIDYPKIPPQSAVILLDCSEPERAGPLAEAVKAFPSLTVDHHAAAQTYGTLQYCDPHIPSTTLLIQRLCEALGPEPDKHEARLLLFGFCTDTGFFRHLQNGQYLPAVRRLMDNGISLRQIYETIYHYDGLEQARQLARLIERSRLLAGGRCVLSFLYMEDYLANPANKTVTDEYYRQMQMVEGIGLIILIKAEEKPGSFSVSLRSKPPYNSADLAGARGGGGHKQAAGFTYQGDLKKLEQSIVSQVESLFK